MSMELQSMMNCILAVGGVLLLLYGFEGYYTRRKKLLITGIIGIVALLAVYSLGSAWIYCRSFSG